MTKKRPIDRQREGAITLTIADDGDDSAIKEMLSTSDALYVIKENGIYKIQLADDIDPKRTNPAIPNLNQKVLSAGYNNEVVARILLTSKYLFDENNSTVTPFIGTVFERTLDLTKHVLELHKMIDELRDIIISKEEALSAKPQHPNTFSLPSISSLDQKLHNIFVKSDKVKDGILLLCRLHFLPDATTRPKLIEYDNAIAQLEDKDPNIVSAWNGIKETLGLIRNMRNASEHPKSGQQVVLNDFTMLPDGSINSPHVEIQDKKTPIGLLPVVELLDFIQGQALEISESSIIFIKHTRLLDHNPFSECIYEPMIADRRHPMVKYYRAINLGGQLQILG